jgi:hypothetical protein
MLLRTMQLRDASDTVLVGRKIGAMVTVIVGGHGPSLQVVAGCGFSGLKGRGG